MQTSPAIRRQLGEQRDIGIQESPGILGPVECAGEMEIHLGAGIQEAMHAIGSATVKGKQERGNADGVAVVDTGGILSDSQLQRCQVAMLNSLDDCHQRIIAIRRCTEGQSGSILAMMRAQTPTAAARPGTRYGTPSQGRRQLILLALYFTIVLTHILAFRHSYEFPYFVTDAVQYVTTAQNIADGRGYTIRGQFNSTNPPLYPAFLSVAISQSDDPMWPAFLWQCIVIGLVVFPAYSIARETGLDFAVSALLAAAAGMLPHTFYSAIYMTEVLQYPLFLWACALAYRWLHRPTLSGSVWLGSLLSLLLLNKVNSAVLIIPLLVACGVKVVGMVRRGALSPTAGVRVLLAPGAMLCASQAAWLMFKSAHGGNPLGLYGPAARSSVLSNFSLPLFLAYASDFFLASGLLCVAPLCYFLARRWRTDRPVVLFFGLLFVIQMIWIGVYEGGMTGSLRERLMSFSFPVVGILAARGFADLREVAPPRWCYWFAALPLLLLLGLYAGDPGIPSSFETPWTFAFGAGFMLPLAPHVKTIFAASSVFAIAVGAIALLKTTPQRAVWMFAAFIMLCNAYTFASTAWVLAHGSEGYMNDRRQLVGWLSTHGARAGARVMVISQPAPWELRTFADANQGLLLGCSSGKSPDMIVLWQVETILRWDVRTVCNVKELERSSRVGDLILAEEDLSAMPGIKHIADMAGTPRRLFQIIGSLRRTPDLLR